MKAYPIDSHVTFDNDGIPEYDRAITSEPLRKLIKSLFKTGIDPTVSTNLQVASDEGMNVVVRPGFACVEGCMALEEDARVLAVQAASTEYDRIDTVVLRLNDNDAVRECDLYVVEGIPSSTPVHPDLTRSGSIYEIGLADVFVGRNSTRILASKITDTRFDNSRCGILSSISEIDTTTLNQQMNAWSAEAQADFEDWLVEIRDLLDASAAGHLQVQIDDINTQLTANDKQFVFAYQNGRYGYQIGSTFYPFRPPHTLTKRPTTRGTIDMGADHEYRYVDTSKVPSANSLVGTYSSVSTVNVSSYGATSASQFIAIPNEETVSIRDGSGVSGNFGMGWTKSEATYYKPSLSLSGNILTITPASLKAWGDSPGGICEKTAYISTDIIFKG